ncbi:MAG: hypothetical protein AB1538_10275 [Bacillota bacterium]
MFGTLLVALLFLFFASSSGAEQNIRLDGKFEDWRGRTVLSDREGDGSAGLDLKKLSWGTTENEKQLYFMIERHPVTGKPTGTLQFRMFFDINANGSYKDSIDKFTEITFNPGESSGEVDIRLYSVTGKFLSDYRGEWGDGLREGGTRFEFAIPMEDLNVYPSQPVNFYLTGIGSAGDRLPDYGDIMWTPFPVMVKNKLSLTAVSIFWIAVTVFFYRHRIWLFYYIWGAVGFTFLLVSFLRGSFVEYQLEHQAAVILHHLLNYVDIRTDVFDRAVGTLLIMTEVDNSWTVLNVDIENSGLLEMCILLGLIIFYPPYKPTRKAIFSLVAVVCVYAINLLRLFIVVFSIHWFGRDIASIAHSILGRLVFFILIVALYWEILTKPSLKIVRENIENDASITGKGT